MNFISDMLIRIKNGSKAKRKQIILHPLSSKTCYKILEILRDEGYIWGFEVKYNFETKRYEIVVFLKYNSIGVPVIQEISIISKFSRRFFCNTKSLWKAKSNMGISILSTPKGILTDRDARLLNTGGEVICYIS